MLTELKAWKTPGGRVFEVKEDAEKAALEEHWLEKLNELEGLIERAPAEDPYEGASSREVARWLLQHYKMERVECKP